MVLHRNDCAVVLMRASDSSATRHDSRGCAHLLPICSSLENCGLTACTVMTSLAGGTCPQLHAYHRFPQAYVQLVRCTCSHTKASAEAEDHAGATRGWKFEPHITEPVQLGLQWQACRACSRKRQRRLTCSPLELSCVLQGQGKTGGPCEAAHHWREPHLSRCHGVHACVLPRSDSPGGLRCEPL